MNPNLRWGILAAGKIAEKFAAAARGTEGTELYAVASQTPGKAEAFAAEFDAKKVYTSYEALVADDAVDAVYVANIHPMHFEAAKLALDAGKAVLCEKPITLNAIQAEELIALARRKNLFLMEAVWMRFNPALTRVKALVDAGRLGRITEISADFSFIAKPDSRQILPELGGGALLDLGIYPIHLANWMIGRFPDEIASACTRTRSGVDGNDRITFRWETGEKAELTCGVETDGCMCAKIIGTEGFIEIPSQFHAAERFTLHTAAGSEEFQMPFRINGYEYEALEVARCLKAGLTESPVLPLDETLETMKLMDRLRADWDVFYPGEIE